MVRLSFAGLLGGLMLLLGGCAQTPVLAPAPDQALAYWQGRLALRIDEAEPTSFFANFELSGQPEHGELLLTSPLGTTLAQLRWSPRYALLRSNGQTRAFDSLDALAIEATGAAIPIAALFGWLQGQPVAADGWQADLSELRAGRLTARRASPPPAAELRLILDQP